MTLRQYNSIKEFPIVFKSITDYHSDDFVLASGETFVGVKKETLGKDDHSIIDLHGHPHHFTGVAFPDLKMKAENKLSEKINTSIDSITYFNN